MKEERKEKREGRERGKGDGELGAREGMKNERKKGGMEGENGEDRVMARKKGEWMEGEGVMEGIREGKGGREKQKEEGRRKRK